MSDGPLSRELIQQRLFDSPFNAFLGLEVLSADPGKSELVMRLNMRPELERAAGSGQWHGGPIAAAIDIVGDYALAMLLGKRSGRPWSRELFYRHALDGLRWSPWR